LKFLLKYVFFLLIIAGLFGFNAHKFYVSVTNLEYREDLKSIQIITKVFADDFEDILKLRYAEEVILSPESESNHADELIDRYIQAKFKIELDGVKQELNYLGKKYKHDQIHLFIEIADVEQFKKAQVSNLLLTDMFDDQKNLIHFKKDGKTKSAVNLKSDAKALLKFN